MRAVREPTGESGDGGPWTADYTVLCTGRPRTCARPASVRGGWPGASLRLGCLPGGPRAPSAPSRGVDVVYRVYGTRADGRAGGHRDVL